LQYILFQALGRAQNRDAAKNSQGQKVAVTADNGGGRSGQGGLDDQPRLAKEPA